jgi:hypothetical protein
MITRYTRRHGDSFSDKMLLRASLSYRGGHWIESIHSKPKVPHLSFRPTKVNKGRHLETGPEGGDW